jgi:hypothetical protein
MGNQIWIWTTQDVGTDSRGVATGHHQEAFAWVARQFWWEASLAELRTKHERTEAAVNLAARSESELDDENVVAN